MKFTTLTIFALSSTVLTSTNAQSPIAICKDTKSLPELAKCVLENADLPIYETCKNYQTFPELIDCVVDNVEPQCVDENIPAEIKQCLDQIEPRSDLKALIINSGCFDDVIGCFRQSMEDFFVTLPSCVEESMTSLAQCFAVNNDSCAESCSGVTPQPIINDPFNLASCRSIQNNIMDPLCDTVSCCKACVDPFEEVAECIVNEVLDLSRVDCDFECPAARRRSLLRGGLLERIRGRNGGLSSTNPTVSDCDPTSTNGCPDNTMPTIPVCYSNSATGCDQVSPVVVETRSKMENCITILAPGYSRADIVGFFECLAEALTNAM